MRKYIQKVLLLCLLFIPATAHAQAQFDIIDGKTDKPILKLDTTQQNISKEGISISRTSAQKSAPERWNFTIKNDSPEDRWLYLNWQITWNKDTDLKQLHYWGGRGEAITGDALNYEPAFGADRNTMMLQAIYDEEEGIALALPPAEIVSDVKQTLLKKDGKYVVQLQIPLALNPGESDTFPVEIYTFTPRYGYLDALQKYFSAHPKSFNTRKDIDPRAAGVGGSRPYLDLYSWTPLEAAEKARRFGDDWDWIYAPFRRTGDIYTRDEFWDYEPARKFNSVRNQPSAAIFRDNVHKIFAGVEKAGAIGAFYVPSFLYAETQLAKERYPDAIIYNPDGSYAKEYTTPWVTGQDNELAMYPWGNKFAEQSMKDAKQLVEEHDIYAFGYDVMAGGRKFRGKGMKESPRRAFDKDGEYVDSSVAVAKMADFTRSLEKNGKKVGLVGNTTSSSRPFLAARSDTIMMEQTPYYEEEYLYAQEGASMALRYAAGHKAVTIWTSWRLPTMLKVDEMSPAELREAYRGVADYIRLSSFRLGAYPAISNTYGVPKTVKILPLLKEVISRGWQAVPAIRGLDKTLPEFIWTARYGDGTNSFITLGNAQKSDWQGKVVIDNDYLGESNYLFIAENDGKVLSQKIKGRTTELEVQIPSHGTLVLRCVAAVPLSFSGDAAVSWDDNGASGTLSIKGNVAPTKVLPAHTGWQLGETKKENWSFTSNYLGSSAADLQDFPYFNDDKTAQIVLPVDATTAEQTAAQQIQDYFKFWGKYGAEKEQDIVLPIVHENEVDNSQPIITVSDKSGKIQRQGNNLQIKNDNLQEAMLQLLKTLDQKYFFAGTIVTEDRWKHQDTYATRDVEYFKKAELAGKTLDAKD